MHRSSVGKHLPKPWSRHWREPISAQGLPDPAHTRRKPRLNSDWLTKPDYGSMQEQMYGTEGNRSMPVGISPAHVLHWQKRIGDRFTGFVAEHPRYMRTIYNRTQLCSFTALSTAV